jgi:hypothetical protein
MTQRDALRHQAAALLQAALPDDASHVATWPAYRRLLTHARAALPLDSPGLKQILDYLDDSGDHTPGLAIQHEIYTHHLHASGPDHPDALATRRQLAHRTEQVEEQYHSE